MGQRKPFLPHAEYVASLARKRMGVAALFQDESGNVLIVKPWYRDSWLLPGGAVEENESPHLACRREVAEELGLDWQLGRILAVDWIAPDADWTEVLMITYDGGVLTGADIAALVLEDGELTGYRFAALDELAGFTGDRMASRVAACLRAIGSGGVAALENGLPAKADE